MNQIVLLNRRKSRYMGNFRWKKQQKAGGSFAFCIEIYKVLNIEVLNNPGLLLVTSIPYYPNLLKLSSDL